MRRGMTLIELMVTLAVSSLVMVGITNAFLAQTRQYQSLTGRRDVQSGGRMGLTMIEEKLRMAGYGVDPHLAIAAYDSWDPEAAGGAGALTGDGDTSFPDAIVIHERDPNFQRQIVAAEPAFITFTPPLTQPIYPGQILLALCSGAQTYTYVTVAAAVGNNRVDLLAAPEPNASPIGLPESRFRDQTGIIANNCFDSGEARLVKIDRYAFFVAAFDEDGSDGTPRLPFLMMHRGLDTNADNNVDIADAVPIAAGAEQLQISYVMNTRPTDPVSVLGVEDRVPAPNGASAWDQQAERPRFSDPYLDNRRFTSNPANIRQVRVTLVTRSRTHNPALEGDNMYTSVDTAWSTGSLATGATVWRQMENLDNVSADSEFYPNGRGYLRSVMRIAVSPKNLLMRSQFLPINFGG
jgi:type IV pilus assembly protein PilW